MQFKSLVKMMLSSTRTKPMEILLVEDGLTDARVTIHALRRIIWIPGVRRGVVEFEGGPKRASRRQRDRRFETERLPLVMIPVRDFEKHPALTVRELDHHPEAPADLDRAW